MDHGCHRFPTRTSYGAWGGGMENRCVPAIDARRPYVSPPARHLGAMDMALRGRRQRRVCALRSAGRLLSGTQPPRPRIQKQVGRNRLLQLSAGEPE